MAKPLDRFAILVMIALCVAWGGNQVAAKIALADFGPMTQCALRNGLGAVLRRRLRRSRRGRRCCAATARWRWACAAGALFTLEFVFLFFAVERTTAASAVVFLFTAPFFVALGAVAFLPAERLAPRQWLGVALAFVGVALGFYRPDGGSTCGDALALAGRRRLGRDDAAHQGDAAAGDRPDQDAALSGRRRDAAFARRWRCGLANRFAARVPRLSASRRCSIRRCWWSASPISIWFWILTRYRAPELSALTFISPVVGVLEGWLALGETADAGVSAGARRRRRRHRAAESGRRGQGRDGAMRNLALRRPALQSSTSRLVLRSESNVDAAVAVSGDRGSERFFHTGDEFFPWWQVDLGGEFLVERVEIDNRRDSRSG